MFPSPETLALVQNIVLLLAIPTAIIELYAIFRM